MRNELGRIDRREHLFYSEEHGGSSGEQRRMGSAS